MSKKFEKTNKCRFFLCLFLVCALILAVLTLCFLKSSVTVGSLPLFAVFAICAGVCVLSYAVVIGIAATKKEAKEDFVLSLEITVVSVVIYAFLPVTFILWIAESVADKVAQKRNAKYQ